MTREEVIAGAEELLEATSAWLAVAVVKQRRAAIGLAAIRAKRRACIFCILNFCEGSVLISSSERSVANLAQGDTGNSKVLHKTKNLASSCHGLSNPLL